MVAETRILASYILNVVSPPWVENHEVHGDGVIASVWGMKSLFSLSSAAVDPPPPSIESRPQPEEAPFNQTRLHEVRLKLKSGSASSVYACIHTHTHRVCCTLMSLSALMIGVFVNEGVLRVCQVVFCPRTSLHQRIRFQELRLRMFVRWDFSLTAAAPSPVSVPVIGPSPPFSRSPCERCLWGRRSDRSGLPSAKSKARLWHFDRWCQPR